MGRETVVLDWSTDQSNNGEKEAWPEKAIIISINSFSRCRVYVVERTRIHQRKYK
jgi:hypothetical protein